MKTQDISAINHFSPTNNYLSVQKGPNGEEHLALIPANYWTGCCRRVCWSSASLSKVQRYMDAHRAGFQNPPSELDRNKLTLLCEKIQSYQQNKSRSICSILYATICWIFSCIFCCRGNPIPLKEKERNISEELQQPISLPSQVKIPVKNEQTAPTLQQRIAANRRAFWEKFQKSAPFFTNFNTFGQCHKGFGAYFHTECSRLQTFLKAPPSHLAQHFNADLVYVCVGHGNVEEQVFPGCVLRALQEGLRVYALLLEHQNSRFGVFSPPMLGLDQECARNPHIDAQKVGLQLNGFSVDQFLCGFPNLYAQTWEDLSDKQKKWIELGIMGDTYWETRAQLQEVIESFKIYINTVLQQGKQVIIGYHSGPISLEDPMVTTYNQFINTHPTQLFFLWGWEGTNRSTNKKIEPADVTHSELTKIWTPYPVAEGGLAATWSLLEPEA